MQHCETEQENLIYTSCFVIYIHLYTSYNQYFQH